MELFVLFIESNILFGSFGKTGQDEKTSEWKGHTTKGESSGGILWSKDDAFTQLMGLERSGQVRGMGFGWTPQEEVQETFHNIPWLCHRPMKPPRGL